MLLIQTEKIVFSFIRNFIFTCIKKKKWFSFQLFFLNLNYFGMKGHIVIENLLRMLLE